MKRSIVTAQFPCDCKTVWDIVTDNENYSWRRDLSKIEIIEEYREYGFVMENKNMSGRWSGIFESRDDGTQITFTEEVQVNNPIMNLFVKGYLKKQQANYIADLRAAIEGEIGEHFD